MNKKSKVAFSLALIVMAAAAVLLTRLQAMQRLGVPGVKIVEQTVKREDGEVAGTNAVALPEAVLNMESHELPVAKVVYDLLPKDTVFGQRVYRAPDGFWTQVSAVLMGSDRTSIHKPEYCLPGQGFRVQKVEFDTVEIREPHSYQLPVAKLTVLRETQAADGRKVSESALYVYWFVADEQLTSKHAQRMLWMAKDLISRGILQRWAYISCFTACPPGHEDQTYSRMREWIAAAVPKFQLATGPASVPAANP